MTNLNYHSHIVLSEELAKALQSEDISISGNAAVFEKLLPQLYGVPDKKCRQLEKVDHYMLLETKELYARLQRFCSVLKIEGNCDFKIARNGEGLTVLGEVPNREVLELVVNRDVWFVDSFNWLQPNYSMLAHSFEMLEFSEYYERAPLSARRKYAHFERADKGALFALRFQQGCINAQVETPINLYSV